jgi:hypothetical protein
VNEPAKRPVSTQRIVQAEACDTRNGMTLDELAGFVQEAMRQEIPGDTIVKIDVTWRCSIKRAEVRG